MRRLEYDVPVGDGMWVHCVEVGDETAPATVLVTNACFLSRDFDKLAEAGLRLVFVDSRGRGGAAPVTRPEQIPGDSGIDDLERVRQHVGAPRVHVIGWSAGGAIAAAYAMDHRDRIDRLLTIGWLPPRTSPPTDDDRSEWEDRMRARVPVEANARLAAMRAAGTDRSDPIAYAREAHFAGAAFQTPRLELLRRRMRSTPWVHPNEHGDHWRQVMSWAAEQPRRRRSRVLGATTLVVYGDSDRTPLRAARDWVWDHEDARLLVLHGIGHYPWLEDPDSFFAIARQFLGGGWPAGAEPIVRPAR